MPIPIAGFLAGIASIYLPLYIRAIADISFESYPWYGVRLAMKWGSDPQRGGTHDVGGFLLRDAGSPRPVEFRGLWRRLVGVRTARSPLAWPRGAPLRAGRP